MLLHVCFDRSDVWWNIVVMRTFTHQDWLENFHMCKETFLYICNKLSSALRKTDTVLQRSLSVERRVAVALWCLATPTEYRTIAHLFGIARSTVFEIVHNTCQCILDVFMKDYIQFPTGDKLNKVVDEFKSKWGVPQCFGAIDGSHVPISAPSNLHTDYYNRKGWYSMLIQGLVDANYCFLDVCIGWPGSVHDARVLAHSALYNEIECNHILPNRTVSISGVDVPLYMIGDSAYPLKKWLMKPFAHNTYLNEQQQNYNYRVCRARIVTEILFGRLKARWRRLLKRNDMHVENIPNVIAAACVLHNICEVHHEHFNDSWLQNCEEHAPPSRTSASRNIPTGEAQNIRSALVDYFQHN